MLMGLLPPESSWSSGGFGCASLSHSQGFSLRTEQEAELEMLAVTTARNAALGTLTFALSAFEQEVRRTCI